MKVPEIKMNVSSDFRQCVLRLANTYHPQFEMPDCFPDQNAAFEEFASRVCKDFSDQLKPIFLKVLHQQFEKHLY